jgi:hypothetical protein
MDTLDNLSYSNRLMAILQQMTSVKEELYAHNLAHASVCFILHGYCISDRQLTDLVNIVNFFRITKDGVDALQNPKSDNHLPLDERARIAAAATAFPEDANFSEAHVSEALQLIADIQLFTAKVREKAMEFIQQAWDSQPPEEFSQEHCPWRWPLLDLVHKLRQSGKVKSWPDVILRI